MTETTYTILRQNLASMLDRVANDREVVVIRRKGEQRVALVQIGRASCRERVSDTV